MSKKIQFAIAALILISISELNAYDNEKTHRVLTEKGVEHSKLADNGGRYLSKNLGQEFIRDQESEVGGKSVVSWFLAGSDFEDGNPAEGADMNKCRAANHFHNPLKPWPEAKQTDLPLSGNGTRLDIHCANLGWILANRKSSVTWATGFDAPVAPDGAKNPVERQIWDWDNARDHYLLALDSETQEDRDEGFSNAFRSLGHIVHLVQDGAQPAHVRNDMQSHLKLVDFDFTDLLNFEELSIPWLAGEWGGSPYEQYVKLHTDDIVSAADPVEPLIDDPSLTDFWDTNQYDGTNPSKERTRGITEITNASYFSLNTLPREIWPLIENPLNGNIYDQTKGVRHD